MEQAPPIDEDISEGQVIKQIELNKAEIDANSPSAKHEKDKNKPNKPSKPSKGIKSGKSNEGSKPNKPNKPHEKKGSSQSQKK
mmetsp:Transcript_2902/g.4493  ORF Transcript_2902/g.4493 Transcript_2902/m.4493 type:complete len:83 (+) Transcript_2902:801-1049(+)|eukprot:CAMPEP_0170506914 /NCGR_PEP_ID=MMETSP0208-20121228/56856_1 /TAXON_ID=197538 /ORGANISM="Strombidium inclinatum, Strain S3" /LENGTH=82 /DNA_ID=CAMNT_0010788771 /DNA_START=793 /DNA_END=1041 /DNA_ORIENTATION=-